MIQIDFRDSRPIYEQIREGMRRMITTGAIKPDEKIPSVRELAGTLAINPNTIQRAYRELEQEGFIYKVTGRGTFASKVNPKESPRRKELLEQFDELVQELYFLDSTREELTWRLKEIEEQHRREIGQGGSEEDRTKQITENKSEGGGQS